MKEYTETYQGVKIILREDNGNWSCSCNVLKNEKTHVLSHPVLRGGFSSKEDALQYVKKQIDVTKNQC